MAMNKYRDRIINLGKEAGAQIVLPEMTDVRVHDAARELISPDQSVITMATAHPSKFMEAIKQVLAEDAVETPSQLKDIEDKQEDFVVLPDNIDKVREYIVSSIN